MQSAPQQSDRATDGKDAFLIASLTTQESGGVQGWREPDEGFQGQAGEPDFLQAGLAMGGGRLYFHRAMASIGPFDFPKDGFKAVIFDCDGTLVDSMPAHFEAWCEALSLYGAAGIFKEDVFFAMGGRPTIDIVVELNDEYDLKLDPVKVAFAKREAFLKRMSSITLIDEVAAFAESLRGKVPMAIASGGSRLVIEKTLRVVGISDWFDEVVTADDVADGKPAPDVFLKAAKLLEVPPMDCLALDDAPAGIIAAQRAGMQVITVPSPVSSFA